MSGDIAALVERLRSLEADLLPFADKKLGSIRIDLGEVRAICGAATTITDLQARLEAERAQNAKLREALEGVLPYVVTASIGCHGYKCRMPWCFSCYDDEDAEQAAISARSAYQTARATLGGEHG